MLTAGKVRGLIKGTIIPHEEIILGKTDYGPVSTLV